MIFYVTHLPEVIIPSLALYAIAVVVVLLMPVLLLPLPRYLRRTLAGDLGVPDLVSRSSTPSTSRTR